MYRGPGLFFQQAPEHPRRLFVKGHALGEHVHGGLVIPLFGDLEHLARRFGSRLMPLYQLADHVGGLGYALVFGNHGMLLELGIGAGCEMPQGSNA